MNGHDLKLFGVKSAAEAGLGPVGFLIFDVTNWLTAKVMTSVFQWEPMNQSCGCCLTTYTYILPWPWQNMYVCFKWV